MAWEFEVGDYSMSCAVTRTANDATVVVVENGRELQRETIVKAVGEDPLAFHGRVWDYAWQLQEQYRPQAQRRVAEESARQLARQNRN